MIAARTARHPATCSVGVDLGPGLDLAFDESLRGGRSWLRGRRCDQSSDHRRTLSGRLSTRSRTDQAVARTSTKRLWLSIAELRSSWLRSHPNEWRIVSQSSTVSTTGRCAASRAAMTMISGRPSERDPAGDACRPRPDRPGRHRSARVRNSLGTRLALDVVATLGACRLPRSCSMVMRHDRCAPGASRPLSADTITLSFLPSSRRTGVSRFSRS